MSTLNQPDAGSLMHSNYLTMDGASASTDASDSYVYNSFPVSNLTKKERWKKFRVTSGESFFNVIFDLGEAKRPTCLAVIDTNVYEDVDAISGGNGDVLVYASDDASFETHEDLSYWRISPKNKTGFRAYLGPDEPSGVWYRHVEDNGYSASGMIVCDDSRILVIMDHGSSDIQQAKLSSDGVIETSFGTDGFREETIAGNPSILSTIRTSGDQILLSARTSGNMSLILLDQDGTVDSGFGTSGVANFTFNSEGDDGKAVVEQATGHFVMAGEARYSSVDRVGIIRVDSSGSETHRMNTLLTGSTAGEDDDIRDVSLDSSDGVYVCGRTEVSGEYQSFVLKTDSTLTLDTGFNSTGIVEFDFSSEGSNLYASDGRSVIVDGSGNVYVICFVRESGVDSDWLGVARFTSAGVLDTTFSSSGKKVFDDIPGLSYFSPAKAVLDSNGNIVIAGTAFMNGVSGVGVVRLNPSGNFDQNMGENGVAHFSVGDGLVVNNLEILSDNRIIICGECDSKEEDTSSAFVVRLFSNGSVDTSFAPEELNDSKRYWKLRFRNADNNEDQWIGYVHLGEYLNIRPEPGTSIDMESRGNTFKAYNSDPTSDELSMLRNADFRTKDMSRADVCAIRDAIEEKGTHSPMVIDLYGRAGDREDQEFGLFYGYLAKSGALDVTRRAPGSEDIKMKFEEAL